MYWAILTKPNRYPVALAHDLQKAPTYCSFAAALSGGIIAAPATINRPQKITFARTDAIALFNELRRPDSRSKRRITPDQLFRYEAASEDVQQFCLVHYGSAFALETHRRRPDERYV